MTSICGCRRGSPYQAPISPEFHSRVPGSCSPAICAWANRDAANPSSGISSICFVGSVSICWFVRPRVPHHRCHSVDSSVLLMAPFYTGRFSLVRCGCRSSGRAGACFQGPDRHLGPPWPRGLLLFPVLYISSVFPMLLISIYAYKLHPFKIPPFTDLSLAITPAPSCPGGIVCRLVWTGG